MIVWVYTCQNATWLEITCHGSYAVGTQNNRLIETLLLSTKTYIKTDGLENVYNFTLKSILTFEFASLTCCVDLNILNVSEKLPVNHIQLT